MSSGLTVVTCPAPYGSGGLGRHLEVVVQALRAEGRRVRYLATAVPEHDPDGVAVPLPAFSRTPFRFHPGCLAWLGNEAFDRAVARRLHSLGEIESLIVFSGAARWTLRRAGAEVETLLESPTVHIDRAAALFRQARRHHPVEPIWLSPLLRMKMRAEYRLARSISVASELARDSFLTAGVPVGRLRRRRLTSAPRFQPRRPHEAHRGLRVVAVGSISVPKGVPVLLDAFARVTDPEACLTLVGGWTNPWMRRYIEHRLRADPRLRVAPGDPLPHLLDADILVHPSYSDGFGLAVAEALAVGVPVLVTVETGAKELIEDPAAVVPVAAAEDMRQRLQALAEGNR